MKLTPGILALLTASKAWGNDWSPYLVERGTGRYNYERKGPHSDSKEDPEHKGGPPGPGPDGKEEKCMPHCCDEKKQGPPHPGPARSFREFLERKGGDSKECSDQCQPGQPRCRPECKHCFDEKESKHGDCPDSCATNMPVDPGTTTPPATTQGVDTGPIDPNEGTTQAADTGTIDPNNCPEGKCGDEPGTTVAADTGEIDPGEVARAYGQGRLVDRLARALTQAEQDFERQKSYYDFYDNARKDRLERLVDVLEARVDRWELARSIEDRLEDVIEQLELDAPRQARKKCSSDADCGGRRNSCYIYKNTQGWCE